MLLHILCTFTAVPRMQSSCFLFFIRHAIEVNKRDYRAWYGLGQTYEILKMPFYCLYYYRKAHQLRFDLLACLFKVIKTLPLNTK